MSPRADSGEAEAALVVAALVPARSEPSHRAERVTEWVCGETLEVVERREEWAWMIGPDGYEAWAPLGSLELVSRSEAAAWRAAATLWSLGTELLDEESRSRGPREGPNGVPWGGRVAPGSRDTVRLPGGTTARPRDPECLVSESERERRFPRAGPAIVETAARWLGAPYAWGGRTGAGVDCSGLVQAVYALHGVSLPRDSGAQAAADPPIEGAPAARRAGRAESGESATRAERDAGSDAGTEAPSTGTGTEAPSTGTGAAAAGMEPERLEPGDLLFFAPEGRGITHVAIAAGGRRIVHAAASRGAVARDDLWSDAPLARRLRGSIVRVTRPLARPAASVGS